MKKNIASHSKLIVVAVLLILGASVYYYNKNKEILAECDKRIVLIHGGAIVKESYYRYYPNIVESIVNNKDFKNKEEATSYCKRELR